MRSKNLKPSVSHMYSYLLLLHSFFVWFLHLIHLHSHIWLLVLKVCFELCELRENLVIRNQPLKQSKAKAEVSWGRLTYLSVLLKDGLIPLLQKSLQWHHFLLQLADENEVVRSPWIHRLGNGTTGGRRKWAWSQQWKRHKGKHM